MSLNSFLNPDGVMRAIGGFVADITIEEDASDELVITQQPVEQGATITDHAYKRPASLIVRAGWSNSSTQAIGQSNYAANMYTALLALQSSRVLISVQTGKRLYTNMLIESIRQVTNQDTEFSLIAEIGLQQVLLAQTVVSAVPPTANQQQPQNTAPPVAQGTQQLGPAQNFNPGAVPEGVVGFI